MKKSKIRILEHCFRLHYVRDLLIHWELASRVCAANVWGKTRVWGQLPPAPLAMCLV